MREDAAVKLEIADSPEKISAEIVRVRHELFDAASQLQPIDGPAELAERLSRVAAELHKIEDGILLLAAVVKLEQDDFGGWVEQIGDRLAGGWEPPSKPVDDVVDSLRRALKDRDNKG